MPPTKILRVRSSPELVMVPSLAWLAALAGGPDRMGGLLEIWSRGTARLGSTYVRGERVWVN